MRIRSLLTLGLVGGAGAALAVALVSRSAHSEQIIDAPNTFAFDMVDAPIGRAFPPVDVAPNVSTHGSTIAAWGDGVIALDGDSGDLVRLDAAGEVSARLAIGDNASQLAVDRRNHRVYVADRAGDRVCIVEADPADAAQLRSAGNLATRAEPYGVALTPDGKTLLVTTVADRSLSAFDLDAGTERWSIDIGPEPRGVAVSFDGKKAIVTYLTTGAVAHVALGDEPRVSYTPIPTGGGVQLAGGFFYGGGRMGDAGAKPAHFARAAFDAAYIGNGLAIVPHQSSSPGQDSMFEDVRTYGGGDGPPIAYRVAMIADGQGIAGTSKIALAELGAHQPRAVAYDAARDTVYIAGYGSDTISAIAYASQNAVRGSRHWEVGEGCGPNGLDVRDNGDVVAFCSLSRRVVTVNAAGDVAKTEPIANSRLSASARRGAELFRRGNSTVLSGDGTLACASCHPEGRTDGLSWRIEGHSLQTPLLAGRMTGTHPFKWDGKDPTLEDSLANTVLRLGGSGISADQVADLEAFVTSLPAPRAPSVRDRKAVARGRRLFHDDAVGCASCHQGDTLSDGKRYDLALDLDAVDTPSLIGLAHSAPYYHDGSAATLEALLLENGSVHGMGNTSALSDGQVSDLSAYLKTL
jgi:DNA-binding beta-propeller fold protein YncE/mono/diheme cytochrome c family protein